MPKHLQATATSVLLCAIALTSAGCSSRTAATRSPSTTASSTATQYPTVLDSVPLHLPVQDYMATDAQVQTIGTARVMLVDGCLQHFNIKRATPPAPVAYGPRSLTDRRYGIFDLALAAKFGFGLGPPSRQTMPAQPDLGADGQTILTGEGRSQINGKNIPEGGCLGEADRALEAHKPAGADTGLPQNLSFESFEWSQHDPRVLAVFKAWSTCMASHQYQYRNPLATAADARFTGSASASKLAIDTATTDIGCKRQTNLIGIWFGVESDYQAEQIRTHAAAFKAVKDALTARLAIARTVLS